MRSVILSPHVHVIAALSCIVILLVRAVILGSRTVLSTADAAVNTAHTILRRLSSLWPSRLIRNSNSSVNSLDSEWAPFLTYSTVSSLATSCVYRSASSDAWVVKGVRLVSVEAKLIFINLLLDSDVASVEVHHLESGASALFNTKLGVVSFLIRSALLDIFIFICVTILLIVDHLLWNRIQVTSFIILLVLWVT